MHNHFSHSGTLTLIFHTPLYSFISQYTLKLHSLYKIASVLTYKHLQQQKSKEHTTQVHPVRHSLFWVFYHCISCSSFVVPIVYWLILFPNYKEVRDDATWWTTVSEHGIQLVFYTIELSMNNMRMEWIYMIHVLGVLILYIIQSVIRNAVYVYLFE